MVQWSNQFKWRQRVFIANSALFGESARVLAPAVALAVALAPTLQLARWVVDTAGFFDEAQEPLLLSSIPPLWHDGLVLRGGAGVGVSWFFRDVEDDAAPPSLQPFLQMAGRVHVEVGGAGSWERLPTDPDLSTGYGGLNRLPAESRSGELNARIDVDGYVRRRLYLGASVGVHASFSHLTNVPSDWTPDRQVATTRLAAEIGVRWRTLLVAAGWAVMPTLTDGPSPFLGGASLRVRGVLRERFDLEAWIQVIDQGAQAGAAATVWLGRRHGIGVSLDGGRSTVGAVLHFSGYTTAGGSLSYTAWISPRVAISVIYQPRWTQSVYYDGMIENTLTLRVAARPLRSR